jgi:thiamine-phosphate pyrophosphorylase
MVTPSGLVLLTDRRLASGSLPRVVAAAVRGGVAWVILRERDLPYAERRALALTLRDLLPPGRLIVSGPDPLGADAVHLAEADPLPAAGVALIGRSCHDVPRLSIEDYATLSPVYPTQSKPGYGPAIAPAAAAELAGRVPWLALGGVDTAERAAACAVAGAQGIAVMGAIMRATDPERVARELAAGFGAASAGRRREETAAASAGRRREETAAARAGRRHGETAADMVTGNVDGINIDVNMDAVNPSSTRGQHDAASDVDGGWAVEPMHETRPTSAVVAAGAAGSARPIGSARPAGTARRAAPPEGRRPGGAVGP